MGSRSVPVGGAAVSAASEKLIESVRLKAADLLEASVADIDFEHGRFQIVGTDRSASFTEVCVSAAAGDELSFDEAETSRRDRQPIPMAPISANGNRP